MITSPLPSPSCEYWGYYHGVRYFSDWHYSLVASTVNNGGKFMNNAGPKAVRRYYVAGVDCLAHENQDAACNGARPSLHSAGASHVKNWVSCV